MIFDPDEVEKEKNFPRDFINKKRLSPVLRKIRDSIEKPPEWDEEGKKKERDKNRDRDRDREPKDNDFRDFILKTIIEQGASEAARLAGRGIRSAIEGLKRRDPGWVLRQVYLLAQRNMGEITISQVISELSVSESMAERVLRKLKEEKICRAEALEGTEMLVYIFPSIVRRYVRNCRYCGSRYRAGDVKGKCPSCLATL
jgi:hypothetical protein